MPPAATSPPRYDSRGGQLHLAAGNRQISPDLAADRYLAAGSPHILRNGSRQTDSAAGHENVSVHSAVDNDLAAGRIEITVYCSGDLHTPAKGEVVAVHDLRGRNRYTTTRSTSAGALLRIRGREKT